MVTVRSPRNLRELYRSFRLVHDQYAAIELIKPRSSRTRFFVRDFLSVTTAFVAVLDKQVVGTASMVRWSPIGLPASGVYHDEISGLLADNAGILVESTKFACAPLPDLSPRGVGKMSIASTALLRALFKWCQHSRVSHWLVVVHPRVKGFYCDQLGFEVLGEERKCSHVADKPGILLGLDVAALTSRRKSPTALAKELFFSSASEEDLFRHYSPHLEEIAMFLLSDTAVWTDCSELERQTLLDSDPRLDIVSSVIEAEPVPKFRRSTPLISLFHPSFDRDESSTHKLGKEYRPAHLALRAVLADLLPVLALHASRREVQFKLSVDDHCPDELVIDADALSGLVAVGCRLFVENSFADDAVVAKISGKIIDHEEILLQFQISCSRQIDPEVYSGIRAELSDYSLALNYVPRQDNSVFECTLAALMVSGALPLGLADYHSSRIGDEHQKLGDDVDASRIQLKILVVEDNIVQQVLLRRILSGRWKHEVLVVGSGEQALDAIKRQSFDLMLLDIQLPGIDGFEVSREMRDSTGEALSTRPLQVYALTSFVLPEDRERCLLAGMDGYLPKPLVLKDLAELLANTIAMKANIGLLAKSAELSSIPVDSVERLESNVRVALRQ